MEHWMSLDVAVDRVMEAVMSKCKCNEKTDYQKWVERENWRHFESHDFGHLSPEHREAAYNYSKAMTKLYNDKGRLWSDHLDD